MHDGMPYDPIQGQGQGQGHDCLKAMESTVSPARNYFLTDLSHVIHSLAR